MQIHYYHVAAFADSPFAGNPAGVCPLLRFPDDDTMQAIAAESRLSQVAFFVPRPDGAFELRWFTPEVEDDLCGHATLATAAVLARRRWASWPVRFHTRSGPLTVSRDGAAFELDLPARPAQSCTPPPSLLPALGLDTAEVLRSRDFVVVVENAEQVRTLNPDIEAIRALDIGLGGVIVTAPEPDRNGYVARFFAPGVGIDEDPVTGSIQCSLAPYWVERLGQPSLRVRQLSERAGTMRCTPCGDRVRISGRATIYLEGKIKLPLRP